MDLKGYLWNMKQPTIMGAIFGVNILYRIYIFQCDIQIIQYKNGTSYNSGYKVLPFGLHPNCSPRSQLFVPARGREVECFDSGELKEGKAGMSKGRGKSVKVKYGNLYFTFIVKDKIKGGIFYFGSAYGY